jgi:hypothetical protein
LMAQLARWLEPLSLAWHLSRVQSVAETRFRRPGLTWPLADVPIRQSALVRDRLPRLQQTPPSTVRSRRSSPQPSCWLCALHRRFMRWMARLSLRCWWQGR